MKLSTPEALCAEWGSLLASPLEEIAVVSRLVDDKLKA